MEYTKCVKCGFEATEEKSFNLKYQDRCYNTSTLADCNWVDMDVREHLHVHCPVCGFLVGAKGCLDYKAKKEEKTDKQWTQQSPIRTTQPSSRFAGGQGYVSPQDTSKGGWDTSECPQCPMTKDA